MLDHFNTFESSINLLFTLFFSTKISSISSCRGFPRVYGKNGRLPKPNITMSKKNVL